MGIYELAFNHLWLPAVEWKYGMNIRKHLRELEQTQWWSIDQLQELQNERLRRLIAHAYEKVPYYHAIFKQRELVPADIQCVYDLPRLPVLTKKNIRENSDELLSSDLKQRRPKRNLTSGSTAERLEFYIDWESWGMAWACIYLGWRLAGYRFGDRMATLSGFSLFPDEEDMTFADRIRVLIERNLQLSVMYMTDDIMEEYAYSIARHRPKFIRAYPNGIYVLANYLKENDLTPVKPKAVFTTAEVLLPKQRSLIEEVFKCPVFDAYGTGDGGANAFECEKHNGYHIPIQRVVMEFVDDDGKSVLAGQPGRIVLTDLFNYSMPFIRYEVGDLGVPGDQKCPCGRGLPLVRSLLGRTSDMIKFRDGSVLSGLAITTILEHFPIQQYQIVQEDLDNLLIRIVRERTYSKEHSYRLLNIIKHHVGRQVDVKLEFVGQIPAAASGKRLFIVSNVPQL